MHQAMLHLEHTASEEVRPWLEAQPPEPWRSPVAHATAAKKLAQTDPAAAMEWVKTIRDQKFLTDIGALQKTPGEKQPAARK